MGTRTIRLAFRGPVHFGRGRLSDGVPTCDAATLFSALFIEAVREGCQGDLIEAARAGELSLSDAFPYVGDVLYLPKPMLPAGAFDERNRARERAGEKVDSRERKANKKLAFVPADGYADYLAGSFDAISALEDFKLGTGYLETKVNLTRSTSEDSEPYHVGGYRFRDGAGIYLVARGSYDPTPLLEQLSYAGLGGKRSSGYGRFEFSVSDADPTTSVASGGHGLGISVLLSTAAPTEVELTDALLDGARYQLVRRGGFVQSTTHADTPQKKRDLYLFAAGSTFARPFEGGVFDVNATPGAHPVWRYARAMWMEV